jgi:hypothetical protein
MVGALELPDHSYLDSSDHCFFMGEYTARAGYGRSSTNQIISNLKKPPSARGTYQWRYKEQAIREVGRALRANLTPTRLPQLTFIPIPPSKPRGHDEFDDRMLKVAQAMGSDLDVREMILTLKEREARHTGTDKRDAGALRETLGLNECQLTPAPLEIMLLDDVLTTGCSFKVCGALLREAFPNIQIWGLFVARRAPEHSDISALFDDLT